MQTTNNKHNQEQDKTAEDLLGVLVAIVIAPVSYTHLTLPTIYSV